MDDRHEIGGSSGRLSWIVAAAAILLLSAALILYKFGTPLLSKPAVAVEVPETVQVVQAVTRDHASSTRAVGTVAATQFVELRNEVPGVVRHVGFRSGAVVPRGAILVQLDSREERARLAAQLARAALARKQLERAEALRSRGFMTPARIDELAAEVSGARAEAEALRAMIAKKDLRAPFRARVGIHDLQPGQYLSDGAMITTLQGVAPTRYVDFTLPQEVAAIVKPGDRVRLSGTGLPPGGISAAIMSRDSAASGSRLVRYRVAVRASEALLPGAFVDVAAAGERARRVVVVPRTALIEKPHASYVFVINPDGKAPGGFRARQQTVRVGSAIGEDMAILSGLSGGERVAAAGAFKLRDGAAVAPAPARPAA